MRGVTVDFALLLYDEFDGGGINDDSVVFRVDGKHVTPLRKREGFYVFRGLNRPEVELEIVRPHYQKEQKRIIKSCLDPGYPVVQVRLLRAYPGNFSDCEWLHGRCPPNTGVLAYLEEQNLRLQVGAEGNRLTVLGYTTGSLVGRRYAVENGDTFLLTEMPFPGDYIADKTMSANPQGTVPMLRAYLSRSGKDGSYHIPIEKDQSGKISATAFYNEENAQWDLLS